jgi:hypothetical protein
MSDDLSQEARRMTELLVGKTVKIVRRHRSSEVLVEFADGTRLFVNGINHAELDFSVTKGWSTENSD